MGVRRTFLIGVEAFDLPVRESVAKIEAALRGHGFRAEDTVRLVGDDLTAACLRSGFTRLAAAAGPSDVIVVYLASHTHVVAVERPDGAHTCVDEIALTGLHGEELTALLHDLCERCPNVAVILDCCDAADVVVVDAGGRAALRSRGLVVLAGSSSGGTALPADAADPILLFTEELCRELERADAAERTWRELGILVGAGVQEQRRSQRVGVAGARHRLLFSLDEGAPDFGDEPALTRGHELHLLFGAALRSFQAGEACEVAKYTWRPRRRDHVAEAIVEAIDPDVALSTCGRLELPRLCYVRRSHRAKFTLRIDRAAAAALDPAAKLADLFPDVRVHARARAGLRWNATRGVVDVHDHAGELIRWVTPGEEALREIDEALARLERWRDLSRALAAQRRPDLKSHFGVYWGLLERSDAEIVERALEFEAEVEAGAAAMFLRVRNRGPGQAIHAQAYRVRADRAILPVVDQEWSVSIGSREHRDLGREGVGARSGIALDWPNALTEAEDVTREWLLLVTSDRPFRTCDVPCDVPDLEGRPPPPPVRGARFHVIVIPYRLRPPRGPRGS